MNAEKLFNDIFLLSNSHTNNDFQLGTSRLLCRCCSLQEKYPSITNVNFSVAMILFQFLAQGDFVKVDSQNIDGVY